MKAVNKYFLTILFSLAFANIFAQANSRDSASVSSDPYSLQYRILTIQDANSSEISSTFKGLKGFQYQSIICRKERELEETTNLPLRFRLGSLRYTDKMEEKYQNYGVDN